jgi:hypothetical protein
MPVVVLFSRAGEAGRLRLRLSHRLDGSLDVATQRVRDRAAGLFFLSEALGHPGP